MSSTNRAGRSVPRTNPEEMMWQGVRPKQQAPLLDQATLAEMQRSNVLMQQDAQVTFSRGDARAANMGIPPHQGQVPSSLSAIVHDEPNFPPTAHLHKHMSMNTNDKLSHKFATI